MLFQVASQGVWSWKELLYEVPWCVVLAAINDQPRYGKRRSPASDGEIRSEAEAREFFGVTNDK